MKLGSLFDRRSPAMVGLDASPSSIKLVELSRDRDGRYTLERCALEPLEHGWIEEGNIENFDEVADAVRRVIRKSGTRAKQVAMALPASVVIGKKVTLPEGLTDREMEVQAEMEAAQYIPFSLDEVNLDFCVMGRSATSPGDVDVMIAASRKDKIEDLRGLAEAANLEPVVIDVESYASRLALARLTGHLVGAGTDAVVALFEIGGFSSSMQVLRGNELLYERELVFGGAQLTQMLVREYGFTLAEAESKKRSGDLPANWVATVLEPFTNTLTQEIERAMRLFFTSTPHNRVDQIFLAGGSAGLSGLVDAISQGTGCPARVVNPFEGMTIGSGVDKAALQRQAASCLTACGLAMRRFLP